MYLLPPRRWVALATGALSTLACVSTMAGDVPCAPDAPCAAEIIVVQNEPSWIFRRGTYTHDPYSGARVAQYMRTPPVEPLDDERIVTSRYRRSRTNLRGADGSVDTYYEVQQWGNGRGGIDAEWERFHDAWKESFLSGGYYNQGPGNFAPWGYGGGYSGPGYGFPGYGFPGYGFPGYGQGGPWQGGPHPGQGGAGNHGGGDHGGGGHGDGDHHGGGGHGGGGHHNDDE
ncbi:MAG: hypothetical protein WD738_01845 [Pirellulales bacterium]